MVQTTLYVEMVFLKINVYVEIAWNRKCVSFNTGGGDSQADELRFLKLQLNINPYPANVENKVSS